MYQAQFSLDNGDEIVKNTDLTFHGFYVLVEIRNI